jgi:D-citramalate synthase
VLDSNLYEQTVVVDSYVLTNAMGLRPSATIGVTIDGDQFEENAQGDGQYDAFMKALTKVYTKKK